MDDIFEYIPLRCAFYTDGLRSNDDHYTFRHTTDANIPTPSQLKNNITGLHMCPNEMCDNSCIGRQCQEYHNKMKRVKDEEKTVR
jgi:hypothetical protein